MVASKSRKNLALHIWTVSNIIIIIIIIIILIETPALAMF